MKNKRNVLCTSQVGKRSNLEEIKKNLRLSQKYSLVSWQLKPQQTT